MKQPLTNAEKQKRWRERHKGDKELFCLLKLWYEYNGKSEKYRTLAKNILIDIDQFYERYKK